MKININAGDPVKLKMEVLIKADPQKVWQVLTDIRRWPVWQKDIKSTEFKEDLEEGASFVWKSGNNTYNAEIHTVENSKEVGWEGSTFGLTTIHNFWLQAENGHTLLKTEESMYGWMTRFFRKTLQKKLDESLKRWLFMLKEESER